MAIAPGGAIAGAHGDVPERSGTLRGCVSWRRLTIDGFDRLLGKGIFYGASRSEASTTQGRDIHLIGAGSSAGQAAMFFANDARRTATTS